MIIIREPKHMHNNINELYLIRFRKLLIQNKIEADYQGK